MTVDIRCLSIIGAGAWGTALACLSRRNGLETRLWVRRPELADSMRRDGQSPYLPDISLDPALLLTTDLAEAARADAVLLVVPAQHLRTIGTALAPHLAPGTPVINCAKGIERDSLKSMSEVMAECLPFASHGVLSGPTFAIEVARGQPAAATLAMNEEPLGRRVQRALGAGRFRPYWSDDIIGAEIGGAVKNVMAIASGIASGFGLGDNARAALLTRGLAEIMRLAEARGGRQRTVMGLSGMGDLLLTCTSMQSRNFSLGVALGQGRLLKEILAERQGVTEGVWTARALVTLAGGLGVDMPIARAADAILNHGTAVDSIVDQLMDRPLRPEE